ncbi:MAG: hypothetical protein WAM62_01280 [Pseudolabrys sp.]|jgi:hypothetical protein
MRFLMIAAAATLLFLPAAAPANACGAAKHSVQATAADYSAKKKPKMKKEKVEYMRAAPMK